MPRHSYVPAQPQGREFQPRGHNESQAVAPSREVPLLF